MLDIIKTKGIAFFLKRLSDKLSEKADNYFSEKRDLKSCTYCEIYIKPEDITPLYDSTKIVYDAIDRAKIIEFANLIIEHKFNLLGSGLQEVTYNGDYNGFDGIEYNPKIEYDNITELLKKSVSENHFQYGNDIVSKLSKDYKPIDWQRDFISGFRWNSKTYYKNIRYGNNEGVDIKVPWELGRLSHLQILFYAWKFTQNEKYLNEFKNQIYDFIAFNPPRFGVQWTTAMDVALRAVNIIATYSLLVSSEADFDDDFKVILNDFLYSHLLHIMNNLEWSSGMRANHYYANICGLIYLSAFLPTDTTTSFVFNFAMNEFLLETDYQFNSDGGNFEASIPYHHFSSEMLFQTFLMVSNLDRNKIGALVNNLNITNSNVFKLHQDLLERIRNHHKAFELKDGRIVFPNDFITKFNKIENFTINLLSPNFTDYLIGDNDDGCFFRFMPLINDDYSIQTGNRSELYKIASFLSRESKRKSFEFFENFGVYIFRNSHYEICVRCGSLGQNGKGGHAHNDQLSFELYAGNDLIICDSGTYNYTASPKSRNKFRSTESHNTLVLENYEQNPITSGRGGGLFWLKDKSKAKMIEYSNSSFTGEHFGYSVPHRRNFKFSDFEISGSDYCAVKGKKRVLFHLTNLSKIVKINANSAIISCGNANFAIESSNGIIKKQASEYSPSYNVKYSTEMIVIESDENEIFWNIILK